ncbi:MAG: hypothetical protein Q8922_05600 [Bacteroidota bacterium]|nr:hypothetical protein [Bacteroidota bacterium]MDP4233122.1 hypothetical protein [Bacteroidota bacterium]MDP4241733.1 hypothetical protein [Bacteroidota bacterium]MDP4287391.1 hypothetical protein [Bacteroidota bacterium]
MRLKTLAFTFAFLTALATSGFAQVPTTPDNGTTNGAMLTPEQRLEKRLAHAQKKLDLSDDQVAKLKTILGENMTKLRTDRQALRSAAEGSAERKAARQQMMSDMKSMREQLKSVLSPEQLKKFKQMRLDQIERQEKRLERQKKMLNK